METLPKTLKLTKHAQERLEERNNSNAIYNVEDLMKSPCKWYTKDDMVENSALYVHSIYVCRKAKEKMGYLTNGKI